MLIKGGSAHVSIRDRTMRRSKSGKAWENVQSLSSGPGERLELTNIDSLYNLSKEVE